MTRPEDCKHSHIVKDVPSIVKGCSELKQLHARCGFRMTCHSVVAFVTLERRPEVLRPDTSANAIRSQEQRRAGNAFIIVEGVCEE